MLGIITFINFSNLSLHKPTGIPTDPRSPAPDQRIQSGRGQPAPYRSPASAAALPSRLGHPSGQLQASSFYSRILILSQAHLANTYGIKSISIELTK